MSVRPLTNIAYPAIALAIGFFQLSNASAATTGLVNVKGVLERSGTLRVDASVGDASTLTNTQLLIDTDADAHTGYTGVAADHGFDVMVEGSTVYTFDSDDAVVWKWKKAGTAKKTVDGAKLTVDVPADVLGKLSPKADVLVRALSSDYKVLASGEAIVGDASPTTGAAAAVEHTGAVGESVPRRQRPAAGRHRQISRRPQPRS